jgi:hypothetical protein
MGFLPDSSLPCPLEWISLLADPYVARGTELGQQLNRDRSYRITDNTVDFLNDPLSRF